MKTDVHPNEAYAAPVAQSCTLSVSLGIVARRDDFRSADSLVRALLASAADSRTWLSALLWLRLRRAGPYRGFAIRCAPDVSKRLVCPTPCRLQFGDTAD